MQAAYRGHLVRKALRGISGEAKQTALDDLRRHESEHPTLTLALTLALALAPYPNTITNTNPHPNPNPNPRHKSEHEELKRRTNAAKKIQSGARYQLAVQERQRP